MKKKILQLSLVLLFVMAGRIYGQESLDCSQFKTGKFDTYVDGKISSKIKRNKKYQTEYSPKTGAKVKLEITWIDECAYRLVFVSANKKFYALRGNEELFPELIVIITEVNGLEYFHESRLTGISDYVYKAKIVKTK